MGRRILFLDVDGVLNNRESMMRVSVPGESIIFKMHPPCVARLRRLVEDVGITLVLSSTWRLAFKDGWENTPRVALDALHRHGWPEAVIDSCTPDLARNDVGGLWSTKGRGEECNAWIAQRGIEGDVYVAVDDDADFATFKGVLVRTEHEAGLTDTNADEIRAAFGVS